MIIRLNQHYLKFHGIYLHINNMYVTAKDDDIKLGKISKYITYMTYSLRINVQVKKKVQC